MRLFSIVTGQYPAGDPQLHPQLGLIRTMMDAPDVLHCSGWDGYGCIVELTDAELLLPVSVTRVRTLNKTPVVLEPLDDFPASFALGFLLYLN